MFSFKKIFIISLLTFMFIMPAGAETLQGEISFTWDKLSQSERDDDIANIKDKIFLNKINFEYDKKEFKKSYKKFFKDKNYKENMFHAGNGKSDLGDRIVVPFYFKKILYGYGLIYKNDLKHCYYYSALGGLFIVEIFEKDYNDYPVVSYHYNKSGKMVGTVYAKSSADDYIYAPDGRFIGRWYKENFYGKEGNVKMTRILPEN